MQQDSLPDLFKPKDSFYLYQIIKVMILMCDQDYLCKVISSTLAQTASYLSVLISKITNLYFLN